MPLRSTRAMTDFVRFVLLDAAALAVAALHLAAVRLGLGDGRHAMDAAGVGTVAILSLAALGGALLIAFAHSAWLASLVSFASGWVLVFGADLLLTGMMPKTFAAMGPAAMAYLFVILASIGAMPLGLLLRLIL